MLTTKSNREKMVGTATRQGLFFQPKLTVNAPNDRYEQEADAMADRVMRMPMPGQAGFLTPSIESIQRKCAACEEEEKHLHRKENSTVAPQVTPGFESYVADLGTRGKPLSAQERGFFEPRFNRDFSDVRIHTDGDAARSAQGINALAYTSGNHIVFNTGQYQPGSDSGKRLLAHELTHVVQQGGSVGTKRIQRLGANPNCTATERDVIHQAIYNARGWINNALSHTEQQPVPANVVSALRRNFGPTYGVVANLELITSRIRQVYRAMATIPFSCAGGANPDSLCDQASAPCGWAVAGSDAATICRSSTLASTNWIYQAGCVLHETFHAVFSRFTVDEYSGWHGNSGSSPTYPGTGVDPLLNADSYSTFIMDLS